MQEALGGTVAQQRQRQRQGARRRGSVATSVGLRLGGRSSRGSRGGWGWGLGLGLGLGLSDCGRSGLAGFSQWSQWSQWSCRLPVAAGGSRWQPVAAAGSVDCSSPSPEAGAGERGRRRQQAASATMRTNVTRRVISCHCHQEEGGPRDGGSCWLGHAGAAAGWAVMAAGFAPCLECCLPLCCVLQAAGRRISILHTRHYYTDISGHQASHLWPMVESMVLLFRMVVARGLYTRTRARRF
jgi:hypothetical protein